MNPACSIKRYYPNKIFVRRIAAATLMVILLSGLTRAFSILPSGDGNPEVKSNRAVGSNRAGIYHNSDLADTSEDKELKQTDGVSGYSWQRPHIIRDSVLSGKKIYFAQKLSGPMPDIDGVLDEECWKESRDWGGNFRQREPDGGEEESQRTEFKIFYDENNIYVAIRAFDKEPGKIERLVSRRDNSAGDIAGIAFDSYFDRRTAFEFDLTAAGSKLDAVPINNGNSWDMNWDPVWFGKTSLEDSAWTAEMRIPLSQLRFAEKDEQVWGLHVWRWVNRRQEEDNWQYVPLDAPGMVHLYGELHGIRGIKPHRQIEFLPYTVARTERTRQIPGNPFANGSSGNVTMGLDGKVGITGDLTLDLTVNPDFGQVEADPSVMNLTAFEVFQSEKRPFFVEGAGILDFRFDGDRMFYSRRIGQTPRYTPSPGPDGFFKSPENTSILSAIKMTGKTRDGLSVGVVQSITSREFADIKTPERTFQQAVEPLTSYFAGRILKEYDQGNTIFGGIITAVNRNIKDKHLEFLTDAAYSGGLDFSHQWDNKTYYITAQTIFSNLKGSNKALRQVQTSSAHYFQRPEASYLQLDSSANTLSGWGGFFEAGKGGNGRWNYAAYASFRSPGLELNDIGFMGMADVITQDATVKYSENKPGKLLRNYSFLIDYFNQWNFGGDKISSGIYTRITAQFNGKWGFSMNNTRNFRFIDTRALRGGPGLMTEGYWDHSTSLYTDKSAKLQFDFTYHKHLYDDHQSDRYDFIPGISWRIGNAFNLRTQYTYRYDKNPLQYVRTFTHLSGEDYILGSLERMTHELTFRFDYNITPELSVQFYASPYISSGRYSAFRKVTDPRAAGHTERCSILSGSEIKYDSEKDSYDILIVPATGLNSQAYSRRLPNPDFTFTQFRSNLVLRWEYSAGSTAYLVWSQGRTEYDRGARFNPGSNLESLAHQYPDNIFLLKVNYWLSI